MMVRSGSSVPTPGLCGLFFRYSADVRENERMLVGIKIDTSGGVERENGVDV